MKWFFLLLIIVNLAVYLWGVQKENARQAHEIVATPGMGNLRLISESDKQEPAKPASPVTDNEEVDTAKQEAPVAAQESGIEEAPQDAASLLAPSSNVLEEFDITRQQVETVSTSDSLLMQKNSNEMSDNNTISNGPLANTPIDPTEEESNSIATVESAPAPIAYCGEIGPVESDEIADSMGRALSAKGLEFKKRKEAIEKSLGFWVIIPALESDEKSIAMVRKLRASGFKDVGRFTKGDDRNSISLGVFSRKENAEMRQNEVAKKGFQTEILEKTKPIIQYWLDYRSEPRLDKPDLAVVLDNYPSTRQIKKSCESIANP